MEGLDVEALDSTIRTMVLDLNRFPGLATIGSCGGHEDPTPAQAPVGEWWVTFWIDRTADDGWFALEFLAWVVNHDRARAQYRARILRDANPPYLNTPGETLRFVLYGHGDDPEQLASWISTTREELFISPADLEEALAEEDSLDVSSSQGRKTMIHLEPDHGILIWP